tara:strand:+ start:18544 stop:18759 length:216 start_codon:yes stop_codon:yes gene_type:complete
MYIDELKIEVIDTYWDDKKKKQSDDTKIVSALKMVDGMNSKSLCRLLDDLNDHYQFRGNIKVMVSIDKSEE